MTSNRPRIAWQLLAAAAVLGLLGLLLSPRDDGVAPGTPDRYTAAAAADYSSFFEGSDLEWSGWTTCPEPIRWTIDVRQLSTVMARREVRRFRQAVASWGAAAGLVTMFKGRQALRYDLSTHQLLPADGSAPKARHIYIGAIAEHVSPLMTGNVIGLAMPSRVITSTRTIITGVAIIRASFVRRESRLRPALLMGLYLHELGHVFGLGHAVLPINAMYPSVRAHTALGPGDVRGVQRATHICDASSSGALPAESEPVTEISAEDYRDSIIFRDRP